MNTSGFDKFEDMSPLTTKNATFMIYEILHSEITEEDTLPFLEFWNIDRIADAGRLHEMYGRVKFCVSGYDNDRRELFEVPEVRKFLRKLVTEWPYFFYADFLDGGFLADLIKCLVPSLTVFASDSAPRKYRVSMKKQEVEAAYLELCNGLIKACSLDDDMSQEKFDVRVEAVKQHLKKGLE